MLRPPGPDPPAPTPPLRVTVIFAPGVPAVRFGLTLTEELALPPEAPAPDLPPEAVRALGLVPAFVEEDAGAFFEGLVLTRAPELGPEPLARLRGTVALERDRCLWAALWPAAEAATGMARAATSAKMVMILFIKHLPFIGTEEGSVSILATNRGRGHHSGVRRYWA